MEAANEKQWRDFWRRLGADGEPMSHWKRLAESYSESWRRYHNLTHIGYCLRESSAIAALAHDPLAVEAAIWFHDVIYDTHRTDNEERSADFAETALAEAGMQSGFLDSIRTLILATKHNLPLVGHDESLLTDIDLSILGQSPEAYAEFEQQIREEYSWVTDKDFSAGRSTILKGFLARASVFSTSEFSQKYEVPARRNLALAISKLGG